MWAEVVKVVGAIAVAVVGGVYAIERVTSEARFQAEREARVELVKRFVQNPDDLNDVFRAIALLVRTGIVNDHDGKLAREVEQFFGVSLGNIVLGTATVTSQAAPVAVAAPTQGPSVPQPTTPLQTAAAALPPPGDSLAARVGLLNDSSAQARTTTASLLVRAIRDQEIALQEQVKVAAALVSMARDDSMRGLTATGRYNLLYVLSEVPGGRWREEGWTDLAGRLRASIDTLQQRIDSRTVAAGPDTQRVLAQLRQRLG